MEPGHSRQIELLFPVHHPTTHDAVSTFHWDARLPVHLPPDCETRRPRRQYIHVRPAQNHICTVLGNYIGKGTAFPAATARPTTVPQDCKTWLRTWRYDPAYTRCPAIGSYCYRKGRANNYVSRRQLTWRNNSLPGKARILPHRYNNHDQSWFAIRTRSRSLFQLRHPVSISYQLQVTVEHQKKRISTLLSSSAAKFRVPIRIGTLGLGVRAPDSLVYYSTIANIQEYTPKFVDTIENENYLPPYDSSRLPEYNTNDPAGPSSTFLA